MMYDELVKRLRECASGECFNCSQYTETTNASICSKELMKQASDAIEGLSAYAELYEELTDKGQKTARKLLDAYPKWVSVKERLPEDLQNVLVIDDGRVTIGHCEHFYGDEQIYVAWHDTLYYPIDPPYWMPLPEPPKEES